MENCFEPCSLESALDTGVTLLTINQRLARALIVAVDQHQINAGKQLWTSVDCLPYQSWLLRCWSRRLDECMEAPYADRYLLNVQQRDWIWRQVIHDHPVGPLLNSTATATMVDRAWDDYCSWSLSWPESVGNGSPDVSAFVSWKMDFLTRSAADQWLDTARLPKVLASWFESSWIDPPPRIILAGFDRLSPQQHQLFLALQRAGSRIQCLQTDARPSLVNKIGLDDESDELIQAARWARQQLEQHPGAVVGIVIPDLQQRREKVDRVFRRICYPGAWFPSQMPDSPAYNLSYGRPLDQYPLVHSALAALRCLVGRHDIEDFGSLLRSRFMVAGEREWTQRSLLESRLRQQGWLQLTWGQLVSQLRLHQHKDCGFCDRLLTAAEVLQRQVDTWSARLLPAEWADCFSAALSELGWPGECTLDSTEYQTLQRWTEMLKEFAVLGEVTGRLRFDEALTELSAWSRRTVFQAKSEGAPIQVMGVLESAGQTFDALWVMGLSHQAWPPVGSPNPYLPHAVQRQAGMPEANPEVQLETAEAHLRQWSCAADQVIFSWPAQSEAGALRASALLSSIPERSPPEMGLQSPKSYEQVLFETAALEVQADGHGPAIDRGSLVRGGVSIIRDQSACPFRAFAYHRLHAEDVEEPAPGLDARSRGSLVHRCLEAVWGKLKSQAALLRLNDAQRMEMVESTVRSSLQEAAAFHPQLKGTFLQIEQQRLVQIVLDWLDVDGQREAFWVEELEQKRAVEIAGISIHTVIDRIDRLDNGSLAIIDYKTGECQVGDWFGERPKDPQLPLYGSQQGDEVSALAFARLKAGKLGYLGVCDEDQSFSMLKPLSKCRGTEVEEDWGAQMQAWSSRIQDLADAFARGEAQVDPRPDACRYCQLDALCRVQQMGVGDDVER